MKKLEFSKILAVWAMIIGTASIVAAFVFSAKGYDPIQDVATTVFTACIGYLITYAGKSLGEKMSRNKHHLDAEGNPITTEEEKNGDIAG